MNEMIETKIYIGCHFLHKNIEFYLVVKNEKLFILQKNTERQKEFLLEVSALRWERCQKSLNLKTKKINTFWQYHIDITRDAINILNESNEHYHGDCVSSSVDIENFIKNYFTQSVNMV